MFTSNERREDLKMEKQAMLFKGSIGEYHRGWFGFLFEVSLSDSGKIECQELFSKFPAIHPEVITDLLKYLCGAGFMAGADNSIVPYDGSRINHVTNRKINQTKGVQVFLKDFTVLRTSNQVSVKEGLKFVGNLLERNKVLLEEISDFTGSFWDIYPFGWIRCESLLSMIGIEKMTIDQYLDQISINLEERKRLFGDLFAYVHRSTGIPIDHDPKRNIFSPKGYHWKIGETAINGSMKKVFLRFCLGDGEGYMGMSLSIAIDHPDVGFFKTSYQMVRDCRGNSIPQFVTAQVSPMQIDERLNYTAKFLPHEKFPSKKISFLAQRAVSKLLDGGNIFDTIIVALMNYYQSEGFESFAGIKGSNNSWLKYHADEIIEQHDKANETVKKRARKIYCERFKRLGFLQINGWWLSNDFFLTMRSALSLQEIGTKKTNLLCRDEKGVELKRIVLLPLLKTLVTEKGLAKIGEAMLENLPTSSSEISDNDFLAWMKILVSKRRIFLALCYNQNINT